MIRDEIILDNHFLINQKLKCLCRVTISHFLYTNVNNSNFSQKILMNFYLKAIDLFDGILELHKANLDECAQALIRVLFENYIKYKHFLLLYDQDQQSAVELVMDSMMIMKERDTITQQKFMKTEEDFIDFFKDMEKIKNKYVREIIINIRKYGFSQLNVETLAKNHNKSIEYDCMYRNYSRNVHANDTAEYLKKQGLLGNAEYIKIRDLNSFSFTFKLFFEMMREMNYRFEFGLDDQFKEIMAKHEASI